MEPKVCLLVQAVMEQASARNILVVEDEGLQRIWLAEVLEDAGFHVLSASTGDSALELLNAAHEDVCAIVTDVQMPGATDGLDLVREVRDRWPHIGVIILSGFTQTASEIPNHAPLLHKPINEPVLLAMLRRIAAGKRLPEHHRPSAG
jgi:two-component system, response regulator PdtaR